MMIVVAFMVFGAGWYHCTSVVFFLRGCGLVTTHTIVVHKHTQTYRVVAHTHTHTYFLKGFLFFFSLMVCTGFNVGTKKWKNPSPETAEFVG